MPLSHEKAVMAGKLGGRPPGTKSQKTKDREKEQEAMNQMVMRKVRPLIRAGLSRALGQQFVYRIDEEKDKDGKVTKREHVLVTSPEEIAEALDQMEGMGRGGDNDEYYYITTKEPDVKAIDMLLNRPFGKPKESTEVEVHHTFSLTALAKKRDALLDVNDDVISITPPIEKEIVPEVVAHESSHTKVITAPSVEDVVVHSAEHI
jgi:hypothetical protein